MDPQYYHRVLLNLFGEFTWCSGTLVQNSAPKDNVFTRVFLNKYIYIYVLYLIVIACLYKIHDVFCKTKLEFQIIIETLYAYTATVWNIRILLFQVPSI